jgi:spore cortex biosynthesis protein YabQ
MTQLIIYSKPLSSANPGLSIVHDIMAFFVMTLVGITIALLFDFFRAMRKATHKTPSVFVQIQDAIFILVSFIVILLMVYIVNDGELRGFIFLGTLAGVLLYKFVFGKFFGKVMYYILFVIVSVITVPVKILILIFKKIFKKSADTTRPMLK